MTIVKHRAEDLPRVDPRPTCVECGADGLDVATRAYCGAVAYLCDACDAPTPQRRRERLTALWLQLVHHHQAGIASDDRVFGALTGLRPDISPHRRWELYDQLDTALHVAKRVAEDDGAHRDLGMSPQEAEEYAAGRVTEALDDLIGGER